MRRHWNGVQPLYVTRQRSVAIAHERALAEDAERQRLALQDQRASASWQHALAWARRPWYLKLWHWANGVRFVPLSWEG